MIITKGMSEVKGYIEYSYDYKRTMMCDDISEDDRACMFESETFTSLEEFLEKTQDAFLGKIKEHLGADRVWISHISFSGKSEDSETTASLSMSESKKNNGHVATTIKNEDVESRLLLNLQQVKKIIDNTLEHYPEHFSK